MDRRAEFEVFARQRGADLLRTADLITWHRATAEDAVQEALLQVFRRWSRVRKMEFPYAYARRVTVAVAVAMAERRRGTVDLANLDVREDLRLADDLDGLAERVDLAAQLSRLPSSQRAVLTLRFFDDLSELETASVLGIAVGTVKSTTSRALARLRLENVITEPIPESLKGVKP